MCRTCRRSLCVLQSVPVDSACTCTGDALHSLSSSLRGNWMNSGTSTGSRCRTGVRGGHTEGVFMRGALRVVLLDGASSSRGGKRKLPELLAADTGA